MALTAPSIYTRSMAPVYDEHSQIMNGNMFQQLFAGPNSYTLFSPDRDTVDIDIIRGDKDVAKFKVRGANAGATGQNEAAGMVHKYTSQSMAFPLIEEYGFVRASQFTNRLAGENPYQGMTQQQRARVLASREHAGHIGRILRKQEVMAAESFRTGALTVNTQGDTLTFGRAAALTTAASSVWTTADYDIITNDVIPAMKALREKHVYGNLGIFGEDAFNAFVNNSTIKSLADNRRLAFHSIGDSSLIGPAPAWLMPLIEAGAQYQGWVKAGTDTIYILTYTDFYINSSGTAVPYMPVSEVLFTNINVRHDRYFGPGEMTDDAMDAMVYREVLGISNQNINTSNLFGRFSNVGLVDSRMFSLGAEKNGTQGYKIISQTAPIYAPTQVDGVFRLTGATS